MTNFNLSLSPDETMKVLKAGPIYASDDIPVYVWIVGRRNEERTFLAVESHEKCDGLAWFLVSALRVCKHRDGVIVDLPGSTGWYPHGNSRLPTKKN